MTTTTIAIGSRTAISGASTAMNSLANATYAVVGTVQFESSGKVPLDAKLEVSVTPGTTSGIPQVDIFAQESLDGTNFGTGPTSGTTNTDLPNLTWLMSIPCNTNATLQRSFCTLATILGGQLPHSLRIIARNATGAALAASGHNAFIQTGSGDTV